MVRIRLRRTGKKKQASYRIVVADSESPRDGRFIENIGFYNPRTDPPTIEVKAERAQYWLSQGAQPSDAVVRLFRKVGVLEQGAPSESDELVAELPAEEEESKPEESAEIEPEGEPEESTEVEPEGEQVPESD